MNTTTNAARFAACWTLQVAKSIDMVMPFYRESMLDGAESQDFEARVKAVAGLIEDVAPCLAVPGDLTITEYESLLQVPLHAELPFFPTTIRARLAFGLIFIYATQTWM